MKELFDRVSYQCSKITAKAYSTSFSLGIRLLNKKIRPHVYAVYGFVRFADEIVDTFHDYDKSGLLDQFKAETWASIKAGISMNPILNSFQHTVNHYGIEDELIETFLRSMEWDLSKKSYNDAYFNEYVLGSAEVVGLMCLRIFCQGDEKRYELLKEDARKLGAAFQKINFLRDIHEDYKELGRSYFPGIDPSRFNDAAKRQIEQKIDEDFAAGFRGIKQLPKNSRFGVYLAYVYYYALFRKIRNTPSEAVMNRRIRISNRRKCRILMSSFVKHQLNLI